MDVVDVEFRVSPGAAAHDVTAGVAGGLVDSALYHDSGWNFLVGGN